MNLNFNGILIDAEVKRVRSMCLRVRRDGTVRLSIPFGTKPEDAYRFVVEHEDWIRKHSEIRKQKQDRLQTLLCHDFHEGELFRVFDKDYPLHHVFHEGQARYHLSESQLVFEGPAEYSSKKKLALVNVFYTTILRREIDALLDYWLPLMGEHHRPVTYSLFAPRTRWGTCQPALRHIKLNMHLLLFPRRCLDLIVVHELCHLKESSHNARFHALMKHYLPDYKEREKILKDHLLS